MPGEIGQRHGKLVAEDGDAKAIGVVGVERHLHAWVAASAGRPWCEQNHLVVCEPLQQAGHGRLCQSDLPRQFGLAQSAALQDKCEEMPTALADRPGAGNERKQGRPSIELFMPDEYIA